VDGQRQRRSPGAISIAVDLDAAETETAETETQPKTKSPISDETSLHRVARDGVYHLRP
jgi:hypothetical protein